MNIKKIDDFCRMNNTIMAASTPDYTAIDNTDDYAVKTGGIN